MFSLMLQIGRRKMASLRDDERGVVMMATLIFILVLYVFCSCVYAIGQAVNDKMRLQNIADAAAHAAAMTEADGLSRIATLNRAMSWTYVQMTRKQMDYIVARWLRLTKDRYDKDRKMVEEHNGKSDGIVSLPVLINASGEFDQYIKSICSRHTVGKVQSGDKGTCWIGWEPDYTDVVYIGHAGMPAGIAAGAQSLEKGFFLPYDGLSDLVKQMKANDIESRLKEQIQGDKAIMALLNMLMEALIRGNPAGPDPGTPPLTERVIDSAVKVIRASIPDEEYGDYCYAISPIRYWWPYENDVNEPYKVPQGEVSVLSPYRNTEEDELELLSMSMKAPHLHNVFGDGIDQWFVRGNEGTFKKKEDAQKKIEPDAENFVQWGLQRGYKSANRMEGGIKSIYGTIYRGNHISDGRATLAQFTSEANRLLAYSPRRNLLQTVKLLYLESCVLLGESILNTALNGSFFNSDISPSAKNWKELFLEQCLEIPDNYGLVSEYRWASMQWACYETIIPWRWTQVGPYRVLLPKGRLPGEHYKTRPLYECPEHGYGRFNFGANFKSHARDEYRSCAIGLDSSQNTHGSTNSVGGYLHRGYSRIYGDDQELWDEDLYIGEIAKPVKLNRLFFEHANVVGLSRKRRNVFERILFPRTQWQDGQLDKRSLYALFNPQSSQWLTAFSAARAAFRERGYPNSWQTKYEVTSSGQVSDGDQTYPIELMTNNDNLANKQWSWRLGCPHAKESNHIDERLERTWNLCETDWIAVFLPLRYVRNGYSAAFDPWSQSGLAVEYVPPTNRQKNVVQQIETIGTWFNLNDHNMVKVTLNPDKVKNDSWMTYINH